MKRQIVCSVILLAMSCASDEEVKTGVVAKRAQGAIVTGSTGSAPKAREDWRLPPEACTVPVNINVIGEETDGYLVELDQGKPTQRPLDATRTVTLRFHGNNEIEYAGRTCVIREFHFHAPSQTFITGQQFPLELHVMQLCEGDPSIRLMTSVLFTEGEPSKFLETLRQSATDSVHVDLAQIKSDESEYHLFLWQHPVVIDHAVRKTPVAASAEQIAAMKENATSQIWLVDQGD